MSYEHSITIQKGHCFRKSGSTGTYREQEFTDKLGDALHNRLAALGWIVHVVLADPPGRQYPDTRFFLALHADGSTNRSAKGASYFYPPRDADESYRWGLYWSAAHQEIAGYPHGFRQPNYVGSVSTGFYAWRENRVQQEIGTPSPICMLAEHYFATNPADDEWAWTPGRIDLMADAHVAAITQYAGTPNTPEGASNMYMIKLNDTTYRVVLPGLGYADVNSPDHWAEVIRKGNETGVYESPHMHILMSPQRFTAFEDEHKPLTTQEIEAIGEEVGEFVPQTYFDVEFDKIVRKLDEAATTATTRQSRLIAAINKGGEGAVSPEELSGILRSLADDILKG